MTKKQIAIIYEGGGGEKTERQLIESLNREFFAPISELVPIMFPAGENIYMLWQKLKEDEFETDVIEVVREYNETAKRKLEGYKCDDFMEVYLFFDYDGHQDNLKGNKEKWISKGKVIVLNSVPLFLLEYFRGEFWDQYI